MTIFIGFAAVNTGNNLLYLMDSALLSYMLISGIFGRKNLRELQLKLEFPAEIYAGRAVPVGVVLHNPKRFFPAHLIKAMIDKQEVVFDFTTATGQDKKYASMLFAERGEHTINSLHLSSVYPFNFFTRYHKIETVFPVTVFPQPSRCSLSELYQQQGRTRGDSLTGAAGYEADLISIRDYVAGDPIKYISWKATAKTGRLKTKQLSTIEQQPVLIDFDRLENPDLEYKISGVTYVILKMLQSHTPVGITIDGQTLQPGVTKGHKLAMLRKLAVYGK